MRASTAQDMQVGWGMQVGRNKAQNRRRHGCLASAAADACSGAADKRECENDYLTCGHRRAQHSILQQQVGRDMQVGRGDTVEKNMAAAAAAEDW